MSIQSFLQHSLNSSKGSAALLVSPPDLGAISQLKTIIAKISKEFNDSVVFATIDASSKNVAPLDLKTRFYDVLKQTVPSKKVVLLIEINDISKADLEFVSDLVFKQSPFGLDLINTHIVLYSHDGSHIPSPLKNKLSVFINDPSGDMENYVQAFSIKDAIQKKRNSTTAQSSENRSKANI